MSDQERASNRESGTAADTPRRRFAPTEHLASEAIAAYVDGELRMNPYLRAAEHLARCPECAAEVEAQQQARIALRQSAQISAPNGLHDTLSRIPLANPAAHRMDDMSGGASFLGLRGELFGFASSHDRELSSDSRRWTGWWRK